MKWNNNNFERSTFNSLTYLFRNNNAIVVILAHFFVYLKQYSGALNGTNKHQTKICDHEFNAPSELIFC